MYTYKQQLRFVEQMDLNDGETARGNCPACGGINTFTATRMAHEMIWNCFRNSCAVKGGQSVDRSHKTLVSAIRDKFNKKEEDTIIIPEFTIPDEFVPIKGRKDAIEYLLENNCAAAVNAGTVKLRYDIAYERVVFLIPDEDGKIVDAVGRSVGDMPNPVIVEPGTEYPYKPKWWRYGSSHSGLMVPFKQGDVTSTCIVVEDATSACVASRTADSYALLGTRLIMETMVPRLKGYNKVIICLDPDATRDAINMAKELAIFIPEVIVRKIPNDLKYFRPQEAKRIIRRGETAFQETTVETVSCGDTAPTE